MGSIERDRTRSRIHDSGRPQRAANSLLSMNSYRLGGLKASVTASPGLLLFCGSSPCFASEINVVSAYPSGQFAVSCKKKNCFRATLIVEDAKGEAGRMAASTYSGNIFL